MTRAATGRPAPTSIDQLAALHADAVATLGTWRPATPDQESLRLDYLAHLASFADGCARLGPPSHLTASCLVLDERGERTLLTLHRKGRFWVQFGGHCEDGDTTLAEAARREGREESGIFTLELWQAAPIDLDRHALSAAFGRCRQHLDVGFLAVLDVEAVLPAASSESVEVAWWPVDDLPRGTVPDLAVRLDRARERLERSRARGQTG